MACFYFAALAWNPTAVDNDNNRFMILAKIVVNIMFLVELQTRMKQHLCLKACFIGFIAVFAIFAFPAMADTNDEFPCLKDPGSPEPCQVSDFGIPNAKTTSFTVGPQGWVYRFNKIFAKVDGYGEPELFYRRGKKNLINAGWYKNNKNAIVEGQYALFPNNYRFMALVEGDLCSNRPQIVFPLQEEIYAAHGRRSDATPDWLAVHQAVPEITFYMADYEPDSYWMNQVQRRYRAIVAITELQCGGLPSAMDIRVERSEPTVRSRGRIQKSGRNPTVIYRAILHPESMEIFHADAEIANAVRAAHETSLALREERRVVQEQAMLEQKELFAKGAMLVMLGVFGIVATNSCTDPDIPDTARPVICDD